MAGKTNGRMALNGNGNGAGNGRLEFFREFIRHPMQIGSVIPSSRFLERRILAAAGIDSAKTVVELGPGTGGTTRAILAAMAPHARLLSIEINPHFHRMVSEIDDRRLIAHLGSACDLAAVVAEHGLPAPDAVISGIPFSTLPPQLGEELVRAIPGVLAPGGCFVAYQARDRVAELCSPVMGKAEASTEFRNIPPMRVYKWTTDGTRIRAD